MEYGELDIVSGTVEMSEDPSFGPLCWKQSTSSASALDAAGTFYFLDKNGIIYAETGPQLESNTKIQAQWKFFDKEQHKRRRCFIKDLEQ